MCTSLSPHNLGGELCRMPSLFQSVNSKENAGIAEIAKMEQREDFYKTEKQRLVSTQRNRGTEINRGNSRQRIRQRVELRVSRLLCSSPLLVCCLHCLTAL